MREFETRVVVERDDLRTKLQHLDAFLERGDLESFVGQEERARLHLQQAIMREYADVLDDRIAHFTTINRVLRDGKT